MNEEKKEYSQLTKGTFLIASPEIESGIFHRSVILLCDHNLSGSLGLIINKDIDFEVGENIIELEDLSNPNVELRAGGPTQMNQMLVLHDNAIEHSTSIVEGLSLGGDLEFLQEALLDSEGPKIRLLFGYSTWAAGQLEKEFLNGQWFVCKGCARHVFETDVENIWREVLKEMGGRFASLSMIPDDLSLN
ncbi:MAG: hypothetical protein S4CHLAM6_07900 [Chlamydiae bacterium]|nr:hypothetical protein [Chlamydiota bacterium]